MATFRILTIEGVDYSLPTASTSISGIVKLNDTLNSTSTTEAATANAVKKAADGASTALTNHINDKATASKFSHVKLSDSVTDSSAAADSVAASPKAVKTVKDSLDTHIADKATSDKFSHVKLSDSTSSDSSTGDSVAATPKAVKSVKDALDTHAAVASTTAKVGHVQLNDATNSTSVTQAATANAVKKVKDALDTHAAVDATASAALGHVKVVKTVGPATGTGAASDSDVPTTKAVRSAITGADSALQTHREQKAGGTTAAPVYGHVAVWVDGTTLYIKGGDAL